MSQAFEVRLIALGRNRLQVIASIRPLLNLPPDECRSLAELGNLVVSQNLFRSSAERLAGELRAHGATVEIGLCGCGCNDGLDHIDAGHVDEDLLSRPVGAS